MSSQSRENVSARQPISSSPQPFTVEVKGRPSWWRGRTAVVTRISNTSFEINYYFYVFAKMKAFFNPNIHSTAGMFKSFYTSDINKQIKDFKIRLNTAGTRFPVVFQLEEEIIEHFKALDDRIKTQVLVLTHLTGNSFSDEMVEKVIENRKALRSQFNQYIKNIVINLKTVPDQKWVTKILEMTQSKYSLVTAKEEESLLTPDTQKHVIIFAAKFLEPTEENLKKLQEKFQILIKSGISKDDAGICQAIRNFEQKIIDSIQSESNILSLFIRYKKIKEISYDNENSKDVILKAIDKRIIEIVKAKIDDPATSYNFGLDELINMYRNIYYSDNDFDHIKNELLVPLKGKIESLVRNQISNVDDINELIENYYHNVQNAPVPIQHSLQGIIMSRVQEVLEEEVNAIDPRKFDDTNVMKLEAEVEAVRARKMALQESSQTAVSTRSVDVNDLIELHCKLIAYLEKIENASRKNPLARRFANWQADRLESDIKFNYNKLFKPIEPITSLEQEIGIVEANILEALASALGRMEFESSVDLEARRFATDIVMKDMSPLISALDAALEDLAKTDVDLENKLKSLRNGDLTVLVPLFSLSNETIKGIIRAQVGLLVEAGKLEVDEEQNNFSLVVLGFLMSKEREQKRLIALYQSVAAEVDSLDLNALQIQVEKGTEQPERLQAKRAVLENRMKKELKETVVKKVVELRKLDAIELDNLEKAKVAEQTKGRTKNDLLKRIKELPFSEESSIEDIDREVTEIQESIERFSALYTQET